MTFCHAFPSYIIWAIMCITVRLLTANSSSRPELSASRQEVPSLPDTRPSYVPRSTPYGLLVQANQLKQQAAYPFIHSIIHLTLLRRPISPLPSLHCGALCVCAQPDLPHLSHSCPHSHYSVLGKRHRHPTLTCNQRRLPNLPLSNHPHPPNTIQLSCSSLFLCVNEQSGLLLLLLLVLIDAHTGNGTRNADGMW